MAGTTRVSVVGVRRGRIGAVGQTQILELFVERAISAHAPYQLCNAALFLQHGVHSEHVLRWLRLECDAHSEPPAVAAAIVAALLQLATELRLTQRMGDSVRLGEASVARV